MKSRGGQSLVELVFAVGIIMLVLSGLAMLIVNSMGMRSRGFDRKKASELSERVIENLIDSEANSSNEFWDLGSNFWATNNGTTQTMTGYTNYYYVVRGTRSTAGDCGATSSFVCASVVVNIGWSGAKAGEEISVNRFFSRR